MYSTYLWFVPKDYPERLVGDYDRTLSPDRFLFLRGQPVETPSKPLIFEVDGKLKELRLYDNIYNNAELPLVGPRLQMLLNNFCPDDIQYLDTIVRAKDGSTQDYKAINLTHTVEAIDYAKCDCRYMDGEPDVIINLRRMVVHPNGLGTYQIARDKRLTPYIFASEKLRQAFLRNHIKGVYLQTVDEYNNFDFSVV